MTQIENFGETQNVTVTVLVDNRADLMVKSTDTVKRFTDEPLLVEHGFAALIDLQDAEVRVLWDAGFTPVALLENMKRLKIDPKIIDRITLSHGHGDHTAGVTAVIRAIGGRPQARKWDKDVTSAEVDRWLESYRVPVIAHPAVFRERWGLEKDGTKFGPGLPPPRAEWEEAGAKIMLVEDPYKLGPGCWTTGAVPRRSFETSGTPPTMAYRESGIFVRDNIDDDQAIVIHVKHKGLVIVAGCAHSGIVNTIDRAREISGVDQIWAILGGFHLGRASDEEIERTIDAIQALKPTMVVPSHCTGFGAISQFARRMPDEFVLGVVGTRYLF